MRFGTARSIKLMGIPNHRDPGSSYSHAWSCQTICCLSHYIQGEALIREPNSSSRLGAICPRMEQYLTANQVQGGGCLKGKTRCQPIFPSMSSCPFSAFKRRNGLPTCRYTMIVLVLERLQRQTVSLMWSQSIASRAAGREFNWNRTTSAPGRCFSW